MKNLRISVNGSNQHYMKSRPDAETPDMYLIEVIATDMEQWNTFKWTSSIERDSFYKDMIFHWRKMLNFSKLGHEY